MKKIRSEPGGQWFGFAAHRFPQKSCTVHGQVVLSRLNSPVSLHCHHTEKKDALNDKLACNLKIVDVQFGAM